jgi:hypothetical protein
MDNGDPDQRTRQNVAALIFLLVLVVGGALLFLALGRRVALLDCLTAGLRNCGNPIDAGNVR